MSSTHRVHTARYETDRSKLIDLRLTHVSHFYRPHLHVGVSGRSHEKATRLNVQFDFAQLAAPRMARSPLTRTVPLRALLSTEDPPFPLCPDADLFFADSMTVCLRPSYFLRRETPTEEPMCAGPLNGIDQCADKAHV